MVSKNEPASRLRSSISSGPAWRLSHQRSAAPDPRTVPPAVSITPAAARRATPVASGSPTSDSTRPQPPAGSAASRRAAVSARLSRRATPTGSARWTSSLCTSRPAAKSGTRPLSRVAPVSRATASEAAVITARLPSAPHNSCRASRPPGERGRAPILNVSPLGSTPSRPRTICSTPPKRADAVPVARVAIQPPTVEWCRDCGSWPRVKPRSFRNLLEDPAHDPGLGR